MPRQVRIPLRNIFDFSTLISAKSTKCTGERKIPVKSVSPAIHFVRLLISGSLKCDGMRDTIDVAAAAAALAVGVVAEAVGGAEGVRGALDACAFVAGGRFVLMLLIIRL